MLKNIEIFSKESHNTLLSNGQRIPTTRVSTKLSLNPGITNMKQAAPLTPFANSLCCCQSADIHVFSQPCVKIESKAA